MKQEIIIKLSDFDIQCQNKEKLTLEDLDNLKSSPYELLRAIKENILTPVVGFGTCSLLEPKDILMAMRVLFTYNDYNYSNKNAIIFFGQPSQAQLEEFLATGAKIYGIIDYAHDQAILEYFNLPNCSFYEFGLDDSFTSLAMTLIHKYEKLNPTILKLMKSSSRNTILKDCNINKSLLNLPRTILNMQSCKLLNRFYLANSLEKYENDDIIGLNFPISHIPILDNVANIGLSSSNMLITDSQLFMQKGDIFCTLDCDKIDILVQYHCNCFKLLALSKLGYELIMSHFTNKCHQNGLMFKIHDDIDTIDKILKSFNESNSIEFDSSYNEYSKKLGL